MPERIVIVLMMVTCSMLVGCTSTRPAPPEEVVELNTVPVFILRVQSSYGDLQQVQVSVGEWLFNGEDAKQFEKRKTPFDIPIAAGDFSLRLEAPEGRPNIKLQLLKGEYKMVGFLQSNCVQVWGNEAGESGVSNCMLGLR